MKKLLCCVSLILVSICTYADRPTITYGIKYNDTDKKNEVWREEADGTLTLLVQFAFPSGGWMPSLSYADDKTGKLYLRDSGGGIPDSEKGWVVYDPETNKITTGVKEGYLDGFQKTFESVLKIDDLIKNEVDPDGKATSVIGSDSIVGSSGSSIIASGTDSADGTVTTIIGSDSIVGSSGSSLIAAGTDSADGTATTIIGSNDVVGADGESLISRESDGSVHIGEDSLVTVETDGVQQLYATDGNDQQIDINIKKGTNLLIDGVSVSSSLAGIAANSIDISANAAEITTNSINISTNSFNLSTITQDIAANAAQISELKQDFKAVTASSFDIDGDGVSEPLTDGLLLLRFLFGFSGDSLVSGAIGPDAKRDTAEAVEAYIKESVPSD